MQLPNFTLAPMQPTDPVRPAAKAGTKQKVEGAGVGRDGVNFSFNVPPPMDPFTAARFAVLGMPDPKVKR